MHILQNTDTGVFTIRPRNISETEALTEFFTGIACETGLEYGGRTRDPEKPNFLRPHIRFEDRELIISGTNEEDARLAFRIRDICYMGSGVVISFIKMETDDQGLAISMLVAGTCKKCGKPCISAGRAEWGTCDECKSLCQHTWKYGAIHGGKTKDGKKLDIGAGYYCTECGMVKPDEGMPADKTLDEHHLSALAHGVVDFILQEQ